MRFMLLLLVLVAIGIAVASARPADTVPSQPHQAKPVGPGGIVEEVLNTPVGLVKSLSSSLTNIFGQVTHVVPELLATVTK